MKLAEALALRADAARRVEQLRAQADVLAREIREIDVRIQRANWEFDLMD